jgi:hypothetical protein
MTYTGRTGMRRDGTTKEGDMSNWDSGFIRLDLTNPAQPVVVGRTVYPSDADGDGHSSQYDEGRELLITADEDFCKSSGSGIEKGYGYMRIYDWSNPASPEQIGSYRTPNSLGTDDQAAGDYVIHNNFLVGTDVCVPPGTRMAYGSSTRATRARPRKLPISCRRPSRTRSSRRSEAS